jgi:hypothetical protein
MVLFIYIWKLFTGHWLLIYFYIYESIRQKILLTILSIKNDEDIWDWLSSLNFFRHLIVDKLLDIYIFLKSKIEYIYFSRVSPRVFYRTGSLSLFSINKFDYFYNERYLHFFCVKFYFYCELSKYNIWNKCFILSIADANRYIAINIQRNFIKTKISVSISYKHIFLVYK